MHEQLAALEQQVVAMLSEQDEATQVDFSRLYTAIAQFDSAASAMQSQISAFVAGSDGSEDKEKRTAFWNDKLVQLERFFLTDAGLPHRNWYKHVVFGPGFFEGYAGTAFPGIADAVAFRDTADLVQAHMDEVTRVVSSAVNFILKE
jgi:N-acetylated-alpha-linked acidic dipeptidase